MSLTSKPALLCSRQWWVGREYVGAKSSRALVKDSETWGNVRTCGMWLVRGMRLCVCVEYSYVGTVWDVWLRRVCLGKCGRLLGRGAAHVLTNRSPYDDR